MSIGDGIGFAALCLAVAVVVIVRRWPELRCSHKWESLGELAVYGTERTENSLPIKHSITYRCEACGASRKYVR